MSLSIPGIILDGFTQQLSYLMAPSKMIMSNFDLLIAILNLFTVFVNLHPDNQDIQQVFNRFQI